ncbi:MAG: DUF2839 domain-containing protein [Cyanobacteriota bacterium]|nr:DUF2839 domain-containing protein [Cyanobacteriota bacterium]
MGEAKRRKAALGDRYGQEERMLPGLPFTKTQGEQFVKITTRGAWVGIGFLIAAWLTVRIIGPALGLWQAG